MTNGIGASTISSAYANTLSKNSGVKGSSNQEQQKGVKNNQQRLDVIKDQIASGEYKVDINELAKKMAEDLMS